MPELLWNWLSSFQRIAESILLLSIFLSLCLYKRGQGEALLSVVHLASDGWIQRCYAKAFFCSLTAITLSFTVWHPDCQYDYRLCCEVSGNSGGAVASASPLQNQCLWLYLWIWHLQIIFAAINQATTMDQVLNSIQFLLRILQARVWMLESETCWRWISSRLPFTAHNACP